MHAPPAVSVLLPVYNGGAYLDEAIASVLAETALALELVIVDDGSADGSSTLIDEWARRDDRVRVIRHRTNLGLIASLNDAVAAARAPLLARQDADDVCRPGRLVAQYEAFAADARLALCWCDYRYVTDGVVGAETYRPPRSHAAMLLGLSVGNRIAHASVMIRASALAAVGGYSAARYPAEDYDLWTRLLRAGAGRGVAVEGLRHRRNPIGISNRNADRQRILAEEIRREHRRALGVSSAAPGGLLAQVLDLRRRSRAALVLARRLGGTTDELDREVLAQARQLGEQRGSPNIARLAVLLTVPRAALHSVRRRLRQARRG